jgi:ribonuclease HI
MYGVTYSANAGEHNHADSIYTSSIGECVHALPKHAQILVGNIPDLDLPANFDCTEPTDLIITTDGSVLFGVGYHSCLIVTKTEQFILQGGGPDDNSPTSMTSYRSELGGICAGLVVIGVLARSGRINLRSVIMVCDNEAAVKRCNQKLTASIYPNTEYDWDMLKTYHNLWEESCQDIPIKVQWVKGHADREGRETTRDKRLNILTDLLDDTTWANARGPHGARPNCPHWPVEKATLLFEGTKVTSGMKQQLASQLMDGKLQEYIIDNKKWSQYTFYSVSWSDYERAFKRL